MMRKFLSLLLLLVAAMAVGSSQAFVSIQPRSTLSNNTRVGIDSLPGLDSLSIKSTSKGPYSPLVLKYAELLKIAPEKINHPEAWTFIDDWMGVRYVWGGDSKKGIDCSAFTQRLLNEVYQVKSSRLVMGQFDKCQLIDSADLRMGDLIFFKTHYKRSGLTHVAFALGGRRFVHASCNKGITIDVLDNSYYRKAYRYSGRILALVNADAANDGQAEKIDLK
jgi:lipoprotein Spr